MMVVTILGCGGSGGVPGIDGDWGACKNTRLNRRTRASILVESGGTRLLIDASQDIHTQFIRERIKTVDAAAMTHAHFDHAHGLPDLRKLSEKIGKDIPVYSDKDTLSNLEEHQSHAFKSRYSSTRLISHPIEIGVVFRIGSLEVTAFQQIHGNQTSLGYRIGDFAYSTDVKSLPEESFEALKGIKTWVVDCADIEEQYTHSHLAQTLDWLKRVKPKRAILTHMNNTLDYEELCRTLRIAIANDIGLPREIYPAHDGLRIKMRPSSSRRWVVSSQCQV
jgi:phosphoribosyl 1,2-cyclic phosphate phosphodiesterase